MAEFKALLERRAQEIEVELNGIKVLLDFLNSALLEKGFKRASMPKTVDSGATVSKKEEGVEEEVVPLKTATGESLANIYITNDTLRLVPSAGMEFNAETPPFTPFLIDRVLEKMRTKDRELVEEGKLQPEQALTYDLSVENGVIRELFVKNIAKERLQELKSTIRWTLEKMYEKIKMTG